jgi:hypothetical protein
VLLLLPMDTAYTAAAEAFVRHVEPCAWHTMLCVLAPWRQLHCTKLVNTPASSLR